ncbi:MerR family transcriptional regulator [Clostridiaceae bacterium M8S5]|nr:MerR family transcriptional regulator [Clostridiaceae bacterium M8S5]
MNNLIKIKDMSRNYNITARTLRYYESMGLLSSTRSEDYAYRMYDENAVRRLEQILILRKLNISIKDIQRVFNTSGSDVVLEVLGKKVERIDDEVSLLHELKEIVLDFIHEIEQVNFANNSDIKLLYNKAKEIETQLIGTDYIGKPSNINRLNKITERLDKKIPDIMVVKIPEFKAVTCSDQPWGEMFKEGGYMYQLWQYCHLYKVVIFDCFDFLISKSDDKAEWICAVKDGVTNADVAPFKLVDFPGGLYAMAVSIDEDNESINKVEDKVGRWIENTNFELDKSRNVMFNMPYLYEDGRDIAYKDIEKGLGYKQMQRYFPIKLREIFKQS